MSKIIDGIITSVQCIIGFTACLIGLMIFYLVFATLLEMVTGIRLPRHR